MKIVDLTQLITIDMPVFPGTPGPELTTVATIKDSGYTDTHLSIGSHTGTHMDSPAHILPHSPTLDKLPVDCFIGRGSVVDITGASNGSIHLQDIQPYELLFKKSDFILLYTGWSRYWGDESYFGRFPVLTTEAALWIHSFGLKGIGVDAVSVDDVDSTSLPIHKILLERSLIIENLTNLGQLPETGFLFSCLPLKYSRADASPVRAVAVIDPLCV